MDRKLAVSTAAAVLWLLGIVYGREAALNAKKECQVPNQFQARVQSVYRLESERAQYEAATDAGCLVLLTAARFPEYRAGDELAVSGKPAPVADIPEEYAGYRTYLIRKGIAATIVYPKTALQKRQESLVSRVRYAIRRDIQKTFPEPEASLMAAMVIGDVGGLSQEVNNAFRRVGVSHILAISGFNVTLLAGIIAGGLLFLPISPRLRAVITIALVWLYVVIAGSPVSAQRAAWFWTLVIVGLRLHLLIGFSSVLILAGLLMISFRPLTLYDAGWQLSMAAVAGIWLTLFLIPGKQVWFLPKWASLLISSSLGAALATWPIVAYHFGLVSLTSLPANLIVVPLTTAFMTVGLTALAASVFAPPLALFISFGVHLIWKAMEAAVFWLDSLPLSALSDVSLPLWTVAAYYGLLAAGITFLMKYQHRSWREIWE